MIQSLGTIKSQVKLTISKKVLNGQIQKIQSTPITFVLRVRAPGKTYFLHFGRGRGFEGLWLSETPPEVQVRIKDKYDDWLKKNLKGCRISRIEADEKQRIISLELQSLAGESIFSIFYKGRNQYFFYQNDEEIFRSWIGKKEFYKEAYLEDPKEQFKGIYEGPDQIEKIQNVMDISILYRDLILYKKSNVKNIKKKIVELKLKLTRIEKSNESLSQLSLLTGDEKKIVKILENLGLKIKMRMNENFFQLRDRAFSKIKNFRNSKNFTIEKLKSLELKMKNGEKKSVLKKTILPVWTIKENKGAKNIKFFTIYNIKGGIGKNTKGNDELRSKYGVHDDVWIHLDSEKSAHVILKIKEKEINETLMALVGSLIRDQMSLKKTELHLIYSKLGGVKGFVGSSGTVTIKNPNYFKVLYNPSWKEIISFD